MMKRDACLQVLARHLTHEIIVAVHQAAQEWLHISPSDLHYTFTGAMGQGSSHALGISALILLHWPSSSILGISA